MATRKLDFRLLNRHILETISAAMYDISVCTTKMTGMTARSDSLSAVNCDASFVKTRRVSIAPGCTRRPGHTETGRKQLCVEVRQELLVFGVKLAHSRHNVAWQAHADDLHDSLENEQGQVGKVGMRAVILLEDLHEAIAGVVVRLRAHGDEAGRVELGGAQA
jgi:hypothetical protein